MESAICSHSVTQQCKTFFKALEFLQTSPQDRLFIQAVESAEQSLKNVCMEIKVKTLYHLRLKIRFKLTMR